MANEGKIKLKVNYAQNQVNQICIDYLVKIEGMSVLKCLKKAMHERARTIQA